jgi:hypothetical protein
MTNNDRTFTLAYGVKLPRDPDTLNRDELMDELYSVAEFASSKIAENRALQNILARHMERGGK